MMKFVIIFLLVFSGNVGWSQKRALDTAAYKLWRRVDAPNISEDGKWVTYHFVHIDSKYDTLPRVTYLYNPEKNIKVEMVALYGNGSRGGFLCLRFDLFVAFAGYEKDILGPGI